MPRAVVVSWREVDRWDLKAARAAAFRREHPSFRPLGEFIEEATELVRPWEDPEKDWPVYGVTNAGGVFFSHTQKGASFNAPYKRIKQDWFFHNPTRANVGSLGRVPDVLEDAVTSPEYQVWRVRSGLLPDYVEILIRLPFFIELIQWHRVGAVKERLFVQNLMDIPIPVLEESQQRAVIKQWQRALKDVQAFEQRSLEIRKETEAGFFYDLGLTPPGDVKRDRCLSVSWSDFQRWSVSYNQARRSGSELLEGRYPIGPLGSLLRSIQYGTSEKANTNCEGTPVLRIKNIKGGCIDLSELKHVVLSPKAVEALLLSQGDILIIRTSGSRDLVGTCAVFREPGDYVFASYLIRLRVDTSRADPDFVAWSLNSPLGRQQVGVLSRHIMQNNINSEEIAALQIPLPPLATQRAIMERVEEGCAGIAEAQRKVRLIAEMAEQQIEEMILGKGPPSREDSERTRA